VQEQESIPAGRTSTIGLGPMDKWGQVDHMEDMEKLVVQTRTASMRSRSLKAAAGEIPGSAGQSFRS